MKQVIYGPPGTGKTTRLLEIVEAYLARGTPPDKIGFLAFTKKAANEARERAAEKFGINTKELVYFRTIHSLVFMQLGLSREQVAQRKHYVELGKSIGIEVTGYTNLEEGTTYGMVSGDRMLFIDGLARCRNISLEQQYSDMFSEDINWYELKYVSDSLAQFKRNFGLIDFTDMLYMYINSGYAPRLEVLIVDEAQDLSPIQWAVIDKIAAEADNVYFAGDDDQAIYRWAGADANRLVAEQAVASSVVLNKSHRIPASVHRLASNIIGNVRGSRVSKHFYPRSIQGMVHYRNSAEEIDLSSGTWLLLARNGYLLKDMAEACQVAGYSYDGFRSPRTSPALDAIIHWERLRRGLDISLAEAKHVVSYITPGIGRDKNKFNVSNYDEKVRFTMNDLVKEAGLTTFEIWHIALDKIGIEEREYFIAARKRGESLVGPPRITISTIHGAKGGEADNVILLTDMAKRTFLDYELFPDDEHRVFYVGATRAKENLYIIEPSGRYYYDL